MKKVNIIIISYNKNILFHYIKFIKKFLELYNDYILVNNIFILSI